MNYRGIIIKESLEDPSILDELKVLSTKTWKYSHDTTWHLYKVEVPEKQIRDFTESLVENISPGSFWYAHFYHEDPANDKVIVVFYKKRRLVSKNNLERAVQYGLSEGIPLDQLDFKPLNIEEETW